MYVLKTARLGLRNWQPTDLQPFIEMNRDEEVMAYFPKLFSEKESIEAYQRLLDHFDKYGFCYFATDLLATGEFIGFIGLLHQDYESYFIPCVDIGWRLRKEFWGNGYAPEGAKACLEYGFERLGLEAIYAVAPKLNLNSERVMQKIGMEKDEEFFHPKISERSPLKPCNLYKATPPTFQ